jgi:hypothetical protein
MDTTLKTHQSSLATLDEDVMRLKEKVETPVEAAPESTPAQDEVSPKPEPTPSEPFPETPKAETLENTESEEGPKQESQKFVEWMENFFSAIWKWFAGLFS